MLPIITLDRIIFPLVVLVFIRQWKRNRINKYPFDLIEYCMLILTVVVIISIYVHKTYRYETAISESLEAGRLQFYSVLTGFVLPFLSFFIMYRAIQTSSQIKSFMIGIGLITVYLGLTSIGEAWKQSWLVFPKYILDPRVGIHFGWVRGPFLNASWTGLAMVMGLPILLWLVFSRGNAIRFLWIGGIVLVGLSLPYVFQRAAWLGAVVAVSLTTLTWARRRPLLLILAITVAAMGSLILPIFLGQHIESRMAQVETWEYRIKLINTSWAIIADHLVTGVGVFRFGRELINYGLRSVYSSHNMPITLFAELGLVGFLPYLSIFALLLFKSVKAYWQLPRSRVLIGGLWGITGAYTIMLLSVELRVALYLNTLFFALWGMMLAIIRKESLMQQVRHVTHRKVISYI